ncbi:MAG: type II secretion system F family protein [Bacteroidota bacterium]
MSRLPPSIAKAKSRAKSTANNTSVFSKEISIPFLSGIPEKSIIEFTRNFAVMTQAKLPLIKAIETSVQQASHAGFKEVLISIQREIKKGKSLSQALQKHPSTFDPIYIQLMLVGEVTGNMPDILIRLANYKEKAQKIKKRIQTALMYPVIIISVAVLAVAFLLVFVVPTFVDLYRDFDADLPLPTQFLLTASNVITGNILYVLAALIVLVFLARRASSNTSVKKRIQQLTFRIPYFGPLYKKGLITSFSKTLDTLLKSGVPLADGLRILMKTTTNLILKEEIEQMNRLIGKGKTLTQSFSNSLIFTPLVVQMIEVGEETSNLDEMLHQLSKHYESEMDLAIEGITSVIEPLLIVFIGLILGVIIVALYLPIFEMVNVIG